MKKIIIGSIVLVISIIAVTLISNNSKKPNFVLANGTGYTVRNIEIRPSKKDYPRNDEIFQIKDINLIDNGFFEIFLSEDMKKYSSFDIAIQYDSNNQDDRERLRWIKTRESIKIDNGIPVFSLSIRGQKNTVANIGVAVGTGAAATAGTAAVVGSILLTIGSIPVAAAALPVVVGVAATSFLLGFSPLTSDSLVIEELGDYRNLKKHLVRK